jgi:hypothetical protein
MRVPLSDTETRVFDFAHANRWRWREEYEGVNLERRRESWKALSDPFRVFEFDFYRITPETLRPEHRNANVRVTANGTCNAMAFWFTLDLGEGADDVTGKAKRIILSTSPHDGTKGQTWQQAVQYFEEFDVREDDTVPLVASHDTYGIKFEVEDGKFPERANRRRSSAAGGKHAPLHDPVWGAAYARAKKIDHQLNTVLTQNPLEYRVAAETALAAGARPADLGFEQEQGAEFCLRLMG